MFAIVCSNVRCVHELDLLLSEPHIWPCMTEGENSSRFSEETLGLLGAVAGKKP